jgi:riboflavin synthase
MFTGIVDHTGDILQVAPSAAGMSMWIASHFTHLVLGESISVDGVCLTVAEINGSKVRFDVSPETLRLTRLNTAKPDQTVNLERALRVGDTLGGHFVTGHVDGLCRLKQREPSGEYISLHFNEVPDSLTRYLVTKGCVCVNGVSLTINSVEANGFSVMLIPHTLQRTNLLLLQMGDPVNLEVDYVARFVLGEFQK